MSWTIPSDPSSWPGTEPESAFSLCLAYVRGAMCVAVDYVYWCGIRSDAHNMYTSVCVSLESVAQETFQPFQMVRESEQMCAVVKRLLHRTNVSHDPQTLPSSLEVRLWLLVWQARPPLPQHRSLAVLAGEVWSGHLGSLFVYRWNVLTQQLHHHNCARVHTTHVNG